MRLTLPLLLGASCLLVWAGAHNAGKNKAAQFEKCIANKTGVTLSYQALMSEGAKKVVLRDLQTGKTRTFNLAEQTMTTWWEHGPTEFSQLPEPDRALGAAVTECYSPDL